MTALPHSFKRIRLSLARSKEFPEGSAERGYEFRDEEGEMHTYLVVSVEAAVERPAGFHDLKALGSSSLLTGTRRPRRVRASPRKAAHKKGGATCS